MESGEHALVHKVSEQLQVAATSSSVPGRLRVADFDHDGFVDVLMTLVNTDLSTSTYLLANVANSTEVGAPRVLKKSNALDEMTQIAGNTAQLITFMDIDEDGRLDFLIQELSDNVPSLKMVYNNIVSDSFFIKALMLNSKQEKSDNIYGDNSMGVSFRFVVTDLDDQKYVVAGS